MEALISGQAGVAVLIHGDTVASFTIDEPDVLVELSSSAIPYIFSQVTDLVEVRGLSKEKALAELKIAWGKDRILQLTLLLLNSEDTEEVRTSAAECIEEFLTNSELKNFLLDRLFMAPSPIIGCTAEAIGIASRANLTHVVDALSHVERYQDEIRRCRLAWDSIPFDAFRDTETRKHFEYVAVTSGAFRRFAETANERKKFDSALMQALQELHKLPNSRTVLVSWTKSFRPQHSKSVSKQIEEEVELSSTTISDKREFRPRRMSAKDALENVIKQKEAIVHLIKRGDIGRARRYVDQLVQFQIGNGDDKYAVMSLCDLAQQAKEASSHSFQLELAKRAVELLPGDGWACGQLADAYFCLEQYDNARRYFEVAEQHGNVAFAATGRARILRAQGLLDEALSVYMRAAEEFPSDVIPWLGRAEVLRDMWRLEDALAVYSEAINKFPHEKVPRCGRAAVLKDLGNLNEALQVYESNISEFPNDQISYGGKAGVLKDMGMLADAFSEYDKAIEKFPDEIVLRNGRASVLREMGKLEEALSEFEDIIASFLPNEFTLAGRAETLKEMGKVTEATLAYDDVAEKFPRAAVALCGKASVLEAKGDLQGALQIYDEAVRKFPREIVPWSARAEVLKKLGQFENALDAYDRLIQRAARDKRLRSTKAAILVAMGRYEEAEALLPVDEPRSLNDWIALHIRGMIRLRKKDFDSALGIFSRGMQHCPWGSERKYFRSAFGLANLHKRRFDEALDAFSDSDVAAPLINVLRIHVNGESGRREEANIAFKSTQSNCPVVLVPLRNELANRYIFSARNTERNDEWIFEEECRLLLLRAA